MEKQIATFKDYAIFLADKTSLLEIARFVVNENYSHHMSSFTEEDINKDIKSVLEEEEYLYDDKSHIYIARDSSGKMIGCIRSFHWDKHKTLPIEKIYGINPLHAVHEEAKYNYWHIGRFAVAKDSGLSTLTLFKRLMALTVKPIVEDKYSYMIAEIDSKLLKVMKVLGFGTRQIGKSIDYLTSETVPVCSSKRGVKGFFSKYGELCKAA
jgi:N-acyl-L-homoserine lactone synthetase